MGKTPNGKTPTSRIWMLAAHCRHRDAPTILHENRINEIRSRVAWETQQADRLCELETGDTRRLDDMSVLLANDAEPARAHIMFPQFTALILHPSVSTCPPAI